MNAAVFPFRHTNISNRWRSVFVFATRTDAPHLEGTDAGTRLTGMKRIWLEKHFTAFRSHSHPPVKLSVPHFSGVEMCCGNATKASEWHICESANVQVQRVLHALIGRTHLELLNEDGHMQPLRNLHSKWWKCQTEFFFEIFANLNLPNALYRLMLLLLLSSIHQRHVLLGTGAQ